MLHVLGDEFTLDVRQTFFKVPDHTQVKFSWGKERERKNRKRKKKCLRFLGLAKIGWPMR